MTALGTRNDFPLPQDVDGGENPLGPSVNTVAASSYSPPQRSFTPTVTAFNDPVRAAALIAAPSEGTQTYRPETGWGSDSDWDAIVERAIAESKSRVPATQATQGLDQDWDAIVEAAIAKTNSATDSDLQHFSSPSMEELNAGRPLEPKPPMVAPENPEGETHEDMIDRTFGIRRGLFGLSFNRPGTEATSPPPTSLGGKVYEAGRQGFQAIVPQVAGAVSTVLTPFANAGSDTAREIQRLTADMHAYASENAALNTAPVDPNAPTTVGSVIEEAVVGAAGALPGLLTQFMAARAFGGMAGFVAGAGVLGAGGQFNESYAEYRKAGFGENSAAANAMANGLIAGTVSAVTNLIPGLAYGYGKDALGKLAQKSGSKLIAKYLGPSGVQAVRVVGVKAVAKAGSVGALKSMVAEGVQETSENIGTDLVVTWRQLNQAEFDQKFKENPEWFKDILVRGWKAGLAGAIMGGGPGAMHGVGKHLSRPVGPEVAPHTVVQGEAALRSAAIERAASEGVEPLRGPATSLEMTDEQARNAVENMVAIEPMVKDAAKDDAEHRRKIGEALDLGKFTDAQLGKLWANGNNGETAKFLGGHAPDLDVSVTPEMAADEIARRRDGRASRVATGAMLGVGEDGKVSDEDLADWMAKNPEAVEYARTATSLPRKRLVKWTNRTGPWNTEAFRSELHKRIKAAKPSVDPRAATAAEIAAEITGLPPAQAELVLRGLSPKTAAAVEAVRSGATPMPTDPKPTAAPQAANTRGVDRIADVNKVERGTVREVEPKSPKVKEFAEKRGVKVKFFESDSPIVTSGAVTDGTVFINSALPEGQQMFAVAAHEVLDSLHVSDPQLWGELEAELRRVAPEAMDAIVREYQQRIKDQDGQTLGENDLRREGVSNMAQAMIDAFGLHLAIDGDGNFDKAKMRELVGMNPGAMAKLARLVDRILRSMGFAGGLNRAQSARLEEFAGRDIKELKSPAIRAFIAQSLGTTLNRMVEARGVSHGDALAQSVDPSPMTERKFYDTYYQHIDLRGREDGNANENKERILRDGFATSMNVNALPASRGGEPSNVIARNYAVQAGDTVYLIPKDGLVPPKKSDNGPKIRAGWKPKPHEVVKITDPSRPMYEYYKDALSQQGSASDGIAQSIDPKKPDKKPKKPKPTDEEKVLKRAARAERREQGRMKAALAAKTVAHLAKGIDSIRSRLADRKRSAQARIDLAHRMGRHEGQSVGQTEGQKQARLEAMRAALKTKRETMRAAKKAWLESVRLAKEIGRQERRSGQVVGEIEGQKKVRREAFREAAKAAAAARRAMKNEQILGQRRIDLSHAIGRHEGQLAGEVEGQKKGRVEGSRVTKKEIKSLLDEAAEAVKQLPTAWQGKYTKRMAAATTKNRMLRVIDSVAKDLAMIPVEQMRGAVARSMKTEAKRIRRRKLTAETAKQVTDLHDAAMAMLSGASGRRLKFTDPADIARRVSIASQLIADARGLSSDEREIPKVSKERRHEDIVEAVSSIKEHLKVKRSVSGTTDEKSAKVNIVRRYVNQQSYSAFTWADEIGPGFGDLMSRLRSGKGRKHKDKVRLRQALLGILARNGYESVEDFGRRAMGLYGDASVKMVDVTLGGVKRSVTMNSAMAIYAQDGETKPKLSMFGFSFKGNKNSKAIIPTEAELDAVKDAIGPEAVRIVDEYKAAVDKATRKRLFDTHFTLNGIMPKAVAEYFRTMRDGDGVADAAKMMSGKESASSYMARTTPMTEERTGSENPFVIDGFMETMDRTVEDSLRFIHLAEPVRHAMSVMLDRGVREEISRTMGDVVNTDLQNIILYGSGAKANPEPGKLAAISHLSGGSKVMLSPITWIKMESGSIGAAAEIPTESWSRGLAKATAMSFKEHAKLLKWVRSENGYFGERVNQSYVGMVSGYAGEPGVADKARVKAAVLAALKDTMSALKASVNGAKDAEGKRSLMGALRDVGKIFKGVGSGAMNAWRLLRTTEFVLHTIDGHVIIRTYLAYKDMVDSKHPEMPERQREIMALAMTEDTHRRSQNTSDTLDDSTFIVNQKAKGGVGQLAFAFSSDPLRGFNQAVGAGLVPWAYKPNVPMRKKIRVAKALVVKAAFSATVGYGVDYAAKAVGRMIGGDDEDKEIQDVIDMAFHEEEQARAAQKFVGELAPSGAGLVGIVSADLLRQMQYQKGVSIGDSVLAVSGTNEVLNDLRRGDVTGSIVATGELFGLSQSRFVNTILTVADRSNQGLDKAYEVLSRKEAKKLTTKKEREVLARIKDRLEAKYEEERKTGKFTTDYGLRKFQAEQRRAQNDANAKMMDELEDK